MYAKALTLLAIVACVSAGVVYDSHIGAQSEQTVRGLGPFGTHTVSHQSKAVDSAFSSVRRSESRVYNPSVVATQAVYQPAVAAPVYTQSLAPVARVASPVYAQAAPAGLLGVRYSGIETAHLYYDAPQVHYAY